jgi:hypothetical protein
MASVGVHREDCALALIRIEKATKGDLTVGGSTTAAALALLVLLTTAGAQCQRNPAYNKHRNQRRGHQQ